MKVLQINTVDAYGSTGKIARGIYDECVERGIQCKIAHRYHELDVKPEDSVAISTYFDCHAHNRLARITRLTGCFSRIRTAKFLKKIDSFSPDVIHLHNLHGNYINVPMLFRYIKKNNTRVIWTLHDCWSFTGGCAHYDMSGCTKWKSGCGDCPCQGFYDITRSVYKLKKKWFMGVRDMLFVTPSKWLSDQVKQSFLKDYPVKVINNGIDLDIFKPTESDFRQSNGLSDKKVVLGVSFSWGYSKGLDVFVELSKKLPEDYMIVLVGTNDNIDQCLPDNILSIHRTQNQKELAKIYSAADVFVNPTREDTFPTVNIEALACGTPVLTFNTGGSPEVIDEKCGKVVERNDVDAMEDAIIHICSGEISKENCISGARLFNKKSKFKEYVDLYEDKKRSYINE